MNFLRNIRDAFGLPAQGPSLSKIANSVGDRLLPGQARRAKIEADKKNAAGDEYTKPTTSESIYNVLNPRPSRRAKAEEARKKAADSVGQSLPELTRSEKLYEALVPGVKRNRLKKEAREREGLRSLQRAAKIQERLDKTADTYIARQQRAKAKATRTADRYERQNIAADKRADRRANKAIDDLLKDIKKQNKDFIASGADTDGTVKKVLDDAAREARKLRREQRAAEKAEAQRIAEEERLAKEAELPKVIWDQTEEENLDEIDENEAVYGTSDQWAKYWAARKRNRKMGILHETLETYNVRIETLNFYGIKESNKDRRDLRIITDRMRYEGMSSNSRTRSRISSDINRYNSMSAAAQRRIS